MPSLSEKDPAGLLFFVTAFLYGIYYNINLPALQVLICGIRPAHLQISLILKIWNSI